MTCIVTTLGDMICSAREILDDLPDPVEGGGDNLSLLQDAAESQDQANLLWKTAELIRYANEAVDEVAIRTSCIRDSSETEGLTTFAIAPGDDPWQAVDRRILRILRVSWNGKALRPTSKTEQDRMSSDWEDETDTPAEFILDQGDRRIRPVPKPLYAGTLRMEVIRLPVEPMVELDDEPVIPQHQRPTAVYWMLHRAYMKNDADTKDDRLSRRYADLFEVHFGPRPSHQALEFQARTLGVNRRARQHWY